MPRLREVHDIKKNFDEALRIDNKEKTHKAGYVKPDKLYHGSPYKIKKGIKLEPRGPTFYGFERPGLSSTKSKGEAKMYAKESDQGGINKKRYGKKIQPKVFAKKGYLYEFDAKSQRGWYKQYHGGHSEPNHWVSNKSQHFDKRSSVRFKGKVPITRNEALAGAAVVGVAGGSYYYYRHRKGKLERVSHHKAFHNTHKSLR